MTEKIQPKFPIQPGLQSREQKYGQGENQRVWEVDYKGVKIGLNLGDIASAPTEAIMCPTTPWLEVGGGGIENRIADVTGEELFGKYTQELLRLLTEIREKDQKTSLLASEELSQFLSNTSGMKINKSPEEVRDDILQATNINGLEDVGERVSIFYGGSIPAPAGRELGKKGIKIVVLTNVTPDHKNMEPEDMVNFTESAAQAANITGVDSITIPGVGTGFAAAMGFGMSLKESMSGFFKGAIQYVDHNLGQTSLKRIDYNIYAQPSDENAKKISELLIKNGTTKLLA